MFERGAVTHELLSIAREVGDNRELAGRICRACVAGLDVDGASISVDSSGSGRQVLCASDPTAELLEELQFSLGEGPSMQACTTGRPVLVPDLNYYTETRGWPVFAAAALEQAGVAALFALPLQWGTIGLGVLVLYRKAAGSLSGAQWRDAMSAADTATLMLLGLRTDPGDGQWLDHSIRSRAEIHQATGMVVVQLGINAQDALARLRAHAFAEQRLLGEVAHDVVTRRLRFGEDE